MAKCIKSSNGGFRIRLGASLNSPLAYRKHGAKTADHYVLQHALSLFEH